MRPGHVIVLLVGLLLVAAPVFLEIRLMDRYLETRSWPTTVTSDLELTSVSTGKGFYYRANYSYFVNGTRFQGTAILMEDLFDRHRTGHSADEQWHTVYYNPEHPQDAFLIRKYPWTSFLHVLLLGCMAWGLGIIRGVAPYFEVWWRSRQTRSLNSNAEVTGKPGRP